MVLAVHAASLGVLSHRLKNERPLVKISVRIVHDFAVDTFRRCARRRRYPRSRNISGCSIRRTVARFLSPPAIRVSSARLLFQSLDSRLHLNVVLAVDFEAAFGRDEAKKAASLT